MEFDPNMITGDPTVDQQHREFFSRLKFIHDTYTTDPASLDLNQTIKELVNFADFHFKSEEALMQSARYPGLAAHRAQHQEIANNVQELFRKYLIENKVMPISLISLLSEWVAEHVADFDKPMVHWIRHNDAQNSNRYQLKITSIPKEFL